MKTGKTSRNQTQHPASRRTAKSAIGPSPWLPATLNANGSDHPVAAENIDERFSEPPQLGVHRIVR